MNQQPQRRTSAGREFMRRFMAPVVLPLALGTAAVEMVFTNGADLSGYVSDVSHPTQTLGRLGHQASYGVHNANHIYHTVADVACIATGIKC